MGQNETDAERSYKKFKLSCEDVQGKNCLTQFYGMNLTTDKLRSMVKKWQTLIEAHVDVKTTDGYLLRVFCIGFTKRVSKQIKKLPTLRVLKCELSERRLSTS